MNVMFFEPLRHLGITCILDIKGVCVRVRVRVCVCMRCLLLKQIKY